MDSVASRLPRAACRVGEPLRPVRTRAVRPSAIHAHQRKRRALRHGRGTAHALSVHLPFGKIVKRGLAFAGAGRRVGFAHDH